MKRIKREQAKLDGTYIPSPPKNSLQRKYLPPYAVSVLSAWFDTHRDNPYPTEPEKKDLAKLAGISVSQVRHWFTNRRRRLVESPVKKKACPNMQYMSPVNNQNNMSQYPNIGMGDNQMILVVEKGEDEMMVEGVCNS